MSDDFKADAARRRLQQIQAERAAAVADLAAHETNSDYDSAAYTAQQIADLDGQAQRVVDLYQRHVQSQQPRQREYLTPEERAARPVEKMDWSDAVELARTSRYGKNIKADDPRMVAGYWEAQRRKGRGE
jgi:hypothetical protein